MVKIYTIFNLAVGKNIIKNLSSKYSQKPSADAKRSGATKVVTCVLKAASEKAISEIVEATGNLIGNKIVFKIT